MLVQIKSLSNIIKYALKDRFEQKCFKRGYTPTSCRPTLLSCDTTSIQIHTDTFYATDTPIFQSYMYIFQLPINSLLILSTITTFRTRQLKFLNGTFKSSHNRRQSRIAFAIQCVSRHPFAGPSFCQTFLPLLVLYEISA